MTDRSESASPSERAGYWVARLASGEMTAGEMAAFKDWLAQAPENRTAFERERALWQSLEGHEAAFAGSMPPLRRTLFRRPIRRQTGETARRRRKALPAFGAATAAMLLAILGPHAVLHIRADEIAATGQVRTVDLPDGSTAMLDSGAAIAVSYDGERRHVELLNGQAWFDVRHGDARPFTVAALGGVTEDIGTAFEVSRGDGSVAVAVSEGSVRISSPTRSHGLRLDALGRARYAEGGTVRRLADASANGIAPWRRGLIVIDGMSVADAVAEIGRYREGYTLLLADTSAKAPVSGVYKIADPDAALQALAEMTGLRVTDVPGATLLTAR